NSNPRDTGGRNEPQEGQACQVSINADASFNRPFNRIGSHRPNRMVPRRWRPRRVLDDNPQHNTNKEGEGKPQFLDTDRMPFTSHENRNLVNDGEPRKQNSIDAPR